MQYKLAFTRHIDIYIYIYIYIAFKTTYSIDLLYVSNEHLVFIIKIKI